MTIFLKVWIVALGALGHLGCTSVFYQPSREIFFEPDDKSTLRFETLEFAAPNGPALSAWSITDPKRPSNGQLVLQFHGNAENMTSHFLSLTWLTQHGYELMTFDYRGYGRSEGTPYPGGVHNDALMAMQVACSRTEHRPGSVILFGQSIGGAIALRALQDFPDKACMRAVVVESSFLSYKSMARTALSGFWLTWPVQWMAYLLVTDRYSPKRGLGDRAPIPLLVTHGIKDPIIPLRHGRRVYDAAAPPKCFWPIDTASHAHLMNTNRGGYRQDLLEFLQESGVKMVAPNNPDWSCVQPTPQG